MFGIDRNKAVPIFLGTSSNRLIKGIFHTERKIVPVNSPPVTTRTMHEAEPDKTEEQQTEGVIY